jgi:hypothetical protein
MSDLVLGLLPELWFRVAASTQCVATMGNATHFAARLWAMTCRSMHAVFKPVLAPHAAELQWWSWFGAYENPEAWSEATFADYHRVDCSLSAAAASDRLEQVIYIWNRSQKLQRETTTLLHNSICEAIRTRRDTMLIWLAARPHPPVPYLAQTVGVYMVLALQAGYSWSMAEALGKLFGDERIDLADRDALTGLFKETKAEDAHHLTSFFDSYRIFDTNAQLTVAALNSGSTVAWGCVIEANQAFLEARAHDLIPYLVRCQRWSLLEPLAKSGWVDAAMLMAEAVSAKFKISELAHLRDLFNEWELDEQELDDMRDAHLLAAASGDAALLRWLSENCPTKDDKLCKEEVEWTLRCLAGYPKL